MTYKLEGVSGGVTEEACMA